MAKITFITGSLPPIRCGIGFYSERLLQELAEAGLKDVAIISTDGVTNSSPFPVQAMPDWGIRRLPGLLKTLRQTNPQVIHIQYPAVGYGRQLGVNLLPYLIRLRLRSARLVLTLHEYHESRWIGRLRNLITAWPVHEIILSNQADKLALPKALDRKSVVIPISSSISKVAPNSKAVERVMDDAQLDPGKPTLLFFGFAHPNKRLEILPPLLSLPQMTRYQALLMTGLDDDATYHQQLKQAFEAFNTGGKRIAWTGFLPDDQISAVLQSGDYFILPQSSPLAAKSSTAITAALHGLIVVSAGGGSSEPFEDNKNACLVWPVTIEAIADAIAKLDSQPEFKQTIKHNAAGLGKYFSWDNIVKLHKEIYEKRS